MTKKHFVEMAKAFKETLALVGENEQARAGVVLSIDAFMRVAKDANNRFDFAKFRKACGLEN